MTDDVDHPGDFDADPDGAVDADYDDAMQDYRDRVADALAAVQQDPVVGGVAIDIVTRQPMYVRQQVADDCAEYYDEEGFCLVSYKMHPWLPGISVDNAVYEAVYLSDIGVQSVHEQGSSRTYDFPAARLMHYPVELTWDAYDVGEV
jgi:hypothetical protein